MAENVKILSADKPLPDLFSQKQGFTLVSYNILLPNGQDEGWWVFKNYRPEVPEEKRCWKHRHSLLREYFLTIFADILCLQEASEPSFQKDFAFLHEAGYESVLHKKFHFRNATFFRKDRWRLLASYHCDKVLVSTLESLKEDKKRLYLVNCHLTGGKDPGRRLRQVYQGLEAIRKSLKAQKKEVLQEAVVVCGDFNTHPGQSGVRQFLMEGLISPEFREPGRPKDVLSSKTKYHGFAPFADAYETAFAPQKRPATLVVSRLWPLFVNKNGELTPEFLDRLQKMFLQFAGENNVMSRTSLESWATKINRRAGRGGERRRALALLEENKEKVLSFENFLSIYAEELRQMRPWAVHHDMAACGVAFSSPERPWEACLDYIYYTPKTLTLHTVRTPLSETQSALIQKGDTLPSAWHPSDHLPLAAAFQWTYPENKR